MRCLRLTPLFVLVVAVLCVGQAQFPDTPAGHQCAAWLESFNRGDRDAYRSFLQKSFPSRVADLDRELRFRQMTGGFDLKKVEGSTPTTLTALVQERASDQMGRLTLEVAGAEPHLITKLGVRAIPRPADFPLPRLNQADLIASAKKEIETEVASDRFAGAVLVAKDGRSILAEAYGLADRQGKVPNTLKTRFRIGSMNKMFTAVSILQLAQAGKLALNDPLGKYLIDYPNKDVAAKVMIHHLLTHTGGTGDIFGPEFDSHRLELRTLQDYVKLYGNRAPEFDPGSQWKYSNYGFILLGVIIERVSGRSYYDYVRDHVYTPAGMTASGSEPEDVAVPDRSVGYTWSPNGQLQPNAGTLPYRATSAGGGYSTVGDLLNFANALQQHKLLNAYYT